MREIKFRAWSIKNPFQKDEPKWVYGDLQRDWDYGAQGSLYIDYFIHTFSGYDRPIQVDGESIGQYTGLKDKNGVEIYEGDVVELFGWGRQIESDGYTTIQWDSDEIGWNFKKNLYAEDRYDFRKAISNCEVIGNIHQNPELL